MKRFLLYISSSCILMSAIAQEVVDSVDVAPQEVAGVQYLTGLFPKQEPLKLKQFGISGFYRFFGTYTDMRDPYLLVEQGQFYTPDRSLFLADDTQLPNLWMMIQGRPSKNTSFGMDVFSFQFYDGNLGETYGNQVPSSQRPSVWDPLGGQRLGSVLGLNLGINLRGSYSTDVGSFAANMGGTHWYYLSDLTFSAFRGYNRFGLFERNPWDPVERAPSDRYGKFFSDGAISQDTRWGNRAFHGLILEGASLPGDMSFSFLYGRTELNGGLTEEPNSSIAGRLKKETKRGSVSYNTWNSRSWSDSLSQEAVGINVHTLKVEHSFDDFELDLEMGGGRYYSRNLFPGFDEAISAKVKLKDNVAGFPIELHYFRIGPNVINNNAQFWNTSIPEANSSAAVAGSAGVLVPFASSMTPVGIMTNNRTGLNLNVEKKVGKKIVLGLGYGVSSEILGLSNQITYSHTVNQLTRSRFWRWNFTPNVGPYNRYSVVYRDAYETVNVDFSTSTTPTRKHFNTLELQGKYKTALGTREVYLFFLGRYGSVSPEFNALLNTSSTAYIRQYSTELEMYMALSPSFIWSNYFGYEQVIGNYRTDIDAVSGRPRDQEGVGFGTGFELSLGKNSVLNLRHRWFAFQDFAFSLDQAKGTESLAEIKVFF